MTTTPSGGAGAKWPHATPAKRRRGVAVVAVAAAAAGRGARFPGPCRTSSWSRWAETPSARDCCARWGGERARPSGCRGDASPRPGGWLNRRRTSGRGGEVVEAAAGAGQGLEQPEPGREEQPRRLQVRRLRLLCLLRRPPPPPEALRRRQRRWWGRTTFTVSGSTRTRTPRSFDEAAQREGAGLANR